MSIILFIVMVISYSVLNNCRGNHFFNTLNSTTLSRIIAFALIGLLTVPVAVASGLPNVWPIAGFTAASLFLWGEFAWDNYWGAAIGSTFNPNKNTFWPADFILRHLPFFKKVYARTASGFLNRMWGGTGMMIRQSLAAITIVGIAYLSGHADRAVYGLGSLILGWMYVVTGYVFGVSYAVPRAEQAVGAILGALVYLTLG